MLLTPHVFVDTQAFVASHFNLEGGRLGRLAALAREGRLALLTTDITTRELHANIAESVRVATGIVQRLREKGRILEHARDPSFTNIFRDFDEGAVAAHLQARLDGFFAAAGAETIGTGHVAERVFSRYFARQPPFGLDKKKHEFPDAFVLEALREWAHEGRTKVYVVSADSDMQAGCAADDGALLHLPNLESLFELVAVEDDEMEVLGEQLVEQTLPTVEHRVTSEFENLGFYLNEPYGDVGIVRVARVDVLQSYIVDAHPGHLGYEAKLEVHFTAELTYGDKSTAYDQDGMMAYPWRALRSTVERTHRFSAYVEVAFSRAPPHEGTVTRLTHDLPHDIGIDVDDTNWVR